MYELLMLKKYSEDGNNDTSGALNIWKDKLTKHFKHLKHKRKVIEQSQHLYNCQFQPFSKNITNNLLFEDNFLNTSIQPRTEHKQPKDEDDDVNDSKCCHLGIGKKTTLVDMPKRDCPEDEAKERVEGGRHDTKERTHTWNDTTGRHRLARVIIRLTDVQNYSLSENEANTPNEDVDYDPGTPSNDTVRVHVRGLAQNTLEDKLGRNVGVERADDDGRDKHERESRLPSPRFRKRSDNGSCRILAAVIVADSSSDGEKNELGNGQCSESLGEILGSLHLSDERRVENLTDPKESDAA